MLESDRSLRTPRDNRRRARSAPRSWLRRNICIRFKITARKKAAQLITFVHTDTADRDTVICHLDLCSFMRSRIIRFSSAALALQPGFDFCSLWIYRISTESLPMKPCTFYTLHPLYLPLFVNRTVAQGKRRDDFTRIAEEIYARKKLARRVRALCARVLRYATRR